MLDHTLLKPPTQLGSFHFALSIVTTVRGFANKVEMSDSESENFDFDNVSDGSESEGYELPVKKASCRHSTRFSSHYPSAYVSCLFRKRLLPPKNPKRSSPLLRRKPQQPRRLLNHESFLPQARRARLQRV